MNEKPERKSQFPTVTQGASGASGADAVKGYTLTEILVMLNPPSDGDIEARVASVSVHTLVASGERVSAELTELPVHRPSRPSTHSGRS